MRRQPGHPHTLALAGASLVPVALALALATMTTMATPVRAGASEPASAAAPFDPHVVGQVLSGSGATLVPPTSPTLAPYTKGCKPLIDAGFTGRCVIARGAGGTVAGIVEVENGTFSAGKSHSAPERDLVWRRQGSHWSLCLRRAFAETGQTSDVLALPLGNAKSTVLVFVTPSPVAGFGSELDVVGGDGFVVLRRFLGQGFAFAPPGGGLVTYVPGWAEQAGPAHAYDQTYMADLGGQWTVVSEQHVPDKAALAQHHGMLQVGQARKKPGNVLGS